MADCDVWERGFESQTLDGCVVAVRVPMFMINGHEHRDSLSVEASCWFSQIMKFNYQNCGPGSILGIATGYGL